MIKLQQIDKTFYIHEQQPLTALKQITLHVEKGQILGVIGASGAGKSTLIRCVNLLERPTSGQVIVDGVDLTQLSERELIFARRQIGMIFQHFNLLSSQTVFDNIALPLKLSGTTQIQTHQKVSELLTLVGLEDKAKAYPANLSGGQKQRVAIARALANNPKVLLCDEATSALDPATTQSILKLLKQINQQLGITILLITHEMDVVKQICDRVAILEHGHLIEQGAVNEIFAHPKTELAQKFIQSTLSIGLSPDDLARLSKTPQSDLSHPVLRLELTGLSAEAPLLSQASKKFDVDFYILSSQIENIDGIKFGFCIVELIGEKQAIEQAQQYLIKQHVKLEILGYVG